MVCGILLTDLEREMLKWAIDTHNSTLDDDENFREDNPELSPIPAISTVAEWPEENLSNILYYLEEQAPNMNPGEPDGIQFGRNCLRTAKKVRAAHPLGATVEAR